MTGPVYIGSGGGTLAAAIMSQMIAALTSTTNTIANSRTQLLALWRAKTSIPNVSI
jgi:hypothetical protein